MKDLPASKRGQKIRADCRHHTSRVNRMNSTQLPRVCSIKSDLDYEEFDRLKRLNHKLPTQFCRSFSRS